MLNVMYLISSAYYIIAIFNGLQATGVPAENHRPPASQ